MKKIMKELDHPMEKENYSASDAMSGCSELFCFGG